MLISEREEEANKQLDNMNKTARSIGLRIAYNRAKTLNTTKD